MRARQTLIVLAKRPVLGRVKTRLAAGIGPVAATAFYRRTLARTLRMLGDDPRWCTVVAVSPDTWRPRGWQVLPQGRGDLGARMARCLNAVPSGPAVLIGADIPGVMPAHIARAFALLRRHPYVLGPASDGGYWLIGARKPVPPLAPVRWSSAHALTDTARLLPGVALGDTLDDVDEAADLRKGL
ncbi:DUF2064 domain-containing protein [Caenispirillum salinarum]|uniref:TIGR04282 family arsenosugar biosynthesis glycosyltransferase n=1 Tax=Caenispirillum salinarum TaxID=859058 RepID=UPI0038505914